MLHEVYFSLLFLFNHFLLFLICIINLLSLEAFGEMGFLSFGEMLGTGLFSLSTLVELTTNLRLY